MDLVLMASVNATLNGPEKLAMFAVVHQIALGMESATRTVGLANVIRVMEVLLVMSSYVMKAVPITDTVKL
jgi:hypothetical protein